VREGPFNRDLVETPQYAKYGAEFGKMTLLQKEWCDYVTEAVRRYGDRTKTFTCSHEWNLNWVFYARERTPQFDIYVKNQTACTLLAYKIVRDIAPNAEFTYGLMAAYRRDAPGGRATTPLYDTVEAWPLGPSFMMARYLETGDSDYLDMLKVCYVFYLSYTDNPVGLSPIYIDSLAGDATEALYNAETTLGGKRFRYRDYIKSFIVLPFSTTGLWSFNRVRGYTEGEQSTNLVASIDNIRAASGRGVPIRSIYLMLVDKNEYYSTYAFDQWRYVTEGIYKMRGEIDLMRTAPATWGIEYEPKVAVNALKEKIALSKRTSSASLLPDRA
jgi:hypothetical protein